MDPALRAAQGVGGYQHQPEAFLAVISLIYPSSHSEEFFTHAKSYSPLLTYIFPRRFLSKPPARGKHTQMFLYICDPRGI